MKNLIMLLAILIALTGLIQSQTEVAKSEVKCSKLESIKEQGGTIYLNCDARKAIQSAF